MSVRMRRGRAGLPRLTHERFARMEAAGTLPDAPEAQQAPPGVPSTPPLSRGGRSQDPRAYQVLALVKKSDGALATEFLCEHRRLSFAVAAASTYRYRAIVINPHSRREFNNWKEIEVETYGEAE